MKVLVTGGAGYIGSVLVPTLLARGFEVKVIDNMMFRQQSLLECCYHSGFEFIRGDIRNESLLKEALRDVDAVIPLAALVGAPLCNQDPLATISTNLDAVKSLCKHAATSQWILMPVTNSGYGIGKSRQYCTEDTPLRPISLYGKTKVEAEAAILSRENSLSFRFATIFGLSPRMRLDLLVNDFVYRAFRDRAIVVFEGHFKRNFLHIRDAVRAFLHGLEKFDSMRGMPYNVGLDDANLSKLELCERIKLHFPDLTYLEAPIGEDPDKRDYIVSNLRIIETGFATEWNLDRGIAELKKGLSLLPSSSMSNI